MPLLFLLTPVTEKRHCVKLAGAINYCLTFQYDTVGRGLAPADHCNNEIRKRRRGQAPALQYVGAVNDCFAYQHNTVGDGFPVPIRFLYLREAETPPLQ